jgi:hypothetical protein
MPRLHLGNIETPVDFGASSSPETNQALAAWGIQHNDRSEPCLIAAPLYSITSGYAEPTISNVVL